MGPQETAKILNNKGHHYSDKAAKQQATYREKIFLPNAHKI